jgi:dTDP-glucose 4,6-dehydratase
MAKETILITGTLGFIGSNLVRRIVHEKFPYRLVCVDYCKSTNPNNIYANRDVGFYLADVADPHAIDIIHQIEKPDYVLHLAAESFVDSAITSATPFIHSNVMGTQVMVDAAVKHNVKKFVLMSTDEVYGALSSEGEASWTEDAPLLPRNPYSASKASAEMIVKSAGITHNLPYSIVRSCNNFGPRQSMRNFIPLVIKNILKGTEMGIYGQGAEIREWMYVDDTCDAIMKIMVDGTVGEAYNAGTGYEMSNLEMFQLIANTIGKGHELIKFVPNRKGHDFRYSLKTDKLKGMGWAPNVKLKQGLHNSVNWYNNNKWYLGGI